MTELEQQLRALAADVEWPATPDAGAGLALSPAPRRRRRGLVVALVAALVGVGVALAVPDARSSILRFLHLGGVTIERVATLPAAEERPLGADLGRPVSPADAATILGAPFRLPRTRGAPVLHENDGTISVLLAAPAPVLLTETATTGLLKKLASISTRVETVEIAPAIDGLWISGAPHVFFGPNAPPRLAGNALVWERDGITYRLEGRSLAKARALELARELAGT